MIQIYNTVETTLSKGPASSVPGRSQKNGGRCSGLEPCSTAAKTAVVGRAVQATRATRTKLSDDSTCPPGHILIVVSTHGHGTALSILHAFTLSPRPSTSVLRLSTFYPQCFRRPGLRRAPRDHLSPAAIACNRQSCLSLTSCPSWASTRVT